jgi:hypothetical protein
MDAAFELDAGADKGDELGAVDLAPSLLGGVEELVGHDQASVLCAGAFGDAGAEPDGGEGELD